MVRRRDVTSNLEELDSLARAELRALWKAELAEEPPSSLGRDILALGIAYGRQERRHGGLAKPVARELDRLLTRALGNDNQPPELHAGPLPRAGTILMREWRGVTHHVTVTDDGFLWKGKPHRSLSGIARAITGTAWNGPRFFGLRETNHKSPEERRDS
jgi:hypothetical protein